MELITVKQLQEACDELENQDREIKKQEERLSALKAQRKQISEETIPSMMDELGIQEIKLANGRTISYKSDITASVSKAKMDDVVRWLEDNGFRDLIKTTVVVHFARNELTAAEQLATQLLADGYDTVLEESVNTTTLKAWIKEQLAAGANIPLDLFGATLFNKTTIKNK